MRKVLFLAAAVVLSLSVMAQSQTTKVRIVGASDKALQVDKLNQVTDASFHMVANPAKPNVDRGNLKGTMAAVIKVPIGSSYNPYTSIVSESTCLTANEDLNVIMFTHRQNNGATGGSGYIQSSFSTNGGFNFDSTTCVIWDATGVGASNYGRYPSGVIYNPTSNTTVGNAYSVISGPVTGGSGWLGSFWASEKLDGTNNNQVYLAYADTATGGTYITFPRIFMQSTESGKVFVQGNANTDDGTYYTSFETIIGIGTFNGGTNAFDWDYISHVPDFVAGTTGPDGYADPGMVFTEDGNTGWLIYTGRDGSALDVLTYQPMIYKSIDGGLNWTKQAAFDWTTITSVADWAAAASPVGRPMFTDVKDITIDEDGYVHFVTFIHGAFSDNADSLGYYGVFANMKGLVFDVHQTAGGWDAFVVDTVWSADVEAGAVFADIGWDERIQMGRSFDGSKIVYSWLETDTVLDPTNLFPDVVVKMYDVTTGTLFPRQNVTRGGSYDGSNYWMYLGDKMFDIGGGLYQPHISTTSHGAADTDPAYHSYFGGLYLDSNDGSLVEGINETPVATYFTVYPNPTSGEVVLTFASDITGDINVSVMNAIGGVVLSENASLDAYGFYRMDMSNLPSGIYMIQVSSENGISTKKIIKQ